VQTVNTRRRWIIEQLSALIRNGSIKKSDDWVQQVFDWLTVNGCFLIKKKNEKSTMFVVSTVCTSSYLFSLFLVARSTKTTLFG